MKTSKSSSGRKAIQVVLAAGVAVGAAQAQAASDIFLRITGLPGESVDDKHKNDIDVFTYSQAVDGKECRLTVLKGVDRASPGLGTAAASENAFPSATLFVRRAGTKDAQEYYTITMQGVKVVAAGQTIARDVNAAEQVELMPKSMTISYRLQNPDGTFGAKVDSTVNCK